MTAIHRFTLKRPCGWIRPFEMNCVNSFASDGCAGSVACGSATSNLCLVPHLSEFVSGSDCGDPDCGTTMPEQWLVVIEWPDLEDTPGFPYTLTNTSAGRIELIGDTIIHPGIFCKILIPFHSDIYPLYDVEALHPFSREFTVAVDLNSFHGLAYLYNERIGAAITPIGGFGPSLDRREVRKSNPSGFCTNHNQVGTFTIIPRELPFGGGTYPQLPITISIYPLAESP